ncbi:WG repeat-containing protein [Flavobacterium sp. F-65]|uniref:WG repeat-containing protein n=1 Tax=Flavobacterium pisciphilum TaxID=2893755 RepID=A0ABS8MYI4_9FLAO|nr:WG repeat-containing protein [Flavobacterium sp. F-65]MCC9072900.1 WG repeat-containing protein [Flavobacterium sp. F-65]
MKHILLLMVLFTNCTIFAQDKDIWVSFWNKDTTLVGFKDKNGNVKIEPKFMGMTSAYKFDGIIAVSEETNNSWKNYYLTKSGKIVGRDSLYVFDNGSDCENEGFIRFSDPKTDKMGMFNSDGEIVIPAEYNSLTKAHNGMVIVLKGAEKVNDTHGGGCNHFGWTGGKQYLIDTNNKILIENFDYSDELNFYSLQKSIAPSKDSIRENFQGVDGQYYSFINYEKEFKSWLTNDLLSDLSIANLLKHSDDEIFYWKEPNGWISNPKTVFIKRNYKLIKNKLLELKSTSCDYTVFNERLNPFIYENKKYDHYFDNCYQAKEWIYPVKNIVISHRDKKDITQDHFEFLRTESGYKLISVTIRKGELK